MQERTFSQDHYPHFTDHDTDPLDDAGFVREALARFTEFPPEPEFSLADDTFADEAGFIADEALEAIIAHELTPVPADEPIVLERPHNGSPMVV